MAKKTYVCVQPCILGGKRYEEGDILPCGIEPNQHFKDAQTGKRVPAPKVEALPVVPSDLQADNAAMNDLRTRLTTLCKELEGMKAGVAGELDELKASLISLSDKVDLLENAVMKKDVSSDSANPVKTKSPVK